MTTDAPFDEVILVTPEGTRRLGARAFFALPLSERIAHVLSRTVTFLARGAEVDRQAALGVLRTMRAAKSA